MDILYTDKRITAVIKPVGVLSADIPAMLLRENPDGNPCVRTVHRLDQPVGGVLLLARSRYAAAELSRQAESRELEKDYLAVVSGKPEAESGRLDDLLYRDKAQRKTLVTDVPSKEARSASLLYETISTKDGLSLLKITLLTGRTHQIRAQLSSRGLPIAGDKKYGSVIEINGIALWSRRLSVTHPESGERMTFEAAPPDIFPWNLFSEVM